MEIMSSEHRSRRTDGNRGRGRAPLPAEGRDRRRPVGSSPQPTEGGRWPGEGEWEAALAAAGRVEGGFGQRVVPRGARACCEE
jgi:hypothetical protein